MDERKRERERDSVCVCVCVKRDFSPYHNPDTVPTPNRFDEGNRAVRNLHSQISFSSYVFAPLIGLFLRATHFASLVIHYSGDRPTGDDTHRCRLFPDYGYIKPQVRDRVKLPRHGWGRWEIKSFRIMNEIIGYFFSSFLPFFFFEKFF